MTSDERQLRELLGRWLTPGLDHPGGFRFHDAPPDVVRRALTVVDPSVAASRPNGQPPAEWLVAVAERLGGLLAGQVGEDESLPERLRVEALCVPAERGAELARAVDADWPHPDMGELALDLALAEGWERWDAEQPVWTAGGRELLAGAPVAVRLVASGGTDVRTEWLTSRNPGAVTTQIAIRLSGDELAALDVEVAEGRATSRSDAVRRGIARLQREQRYSEEEAVLIELARRGEAVYPEPSSVDLPHPPLD